MIKEFKEFIMRGNVLDMAVGIIIGAAFGAIVTSMVNDVIMPPIGIILSGVDFSDAKIQLKDAVPAAGAVAARPAVFLFYGKFINALINFVIVAFVIFMLVKGVNKLKRTAAPPPPPPPPNSRECPLCLSNIPIKASKCAHCTAEVKPA